MQCIDTQICKHLWADKTSKVKPCLSSISCVRAASCVCYQSGMAWWRQFDILVVWWLQNFRRLMVSPILGVVLSTVIAQLYNAPALYLRVCYITYINESSSLGKGADNWMKDWNSFFRRLSGMLSWSLPQFGPTHELLNIVSATSDTNIGCFFTKFW